MKFLSVKLMAAAVILVQPGNAFALNASLEMSQNHVQKVAKVYGHTKAPIGHANFCGAYPRECVSLDSGNLKVRLTLQSYEQLRFVNQSVNYEIEPISDQEQYGVIERWTYPSSGQGDCEDYVLVKRRKLIDSGWPASALLITVVRDEFGEGHAVLTVRTDQGDLVLDNKRSDILPWHKTNYFFIKRQSAVDPRKWISLIPMHSSPTVSSSGSKVSVQGD